MRSSHTNTSVAKMLHFSCNFTICVSCQNFYRRRCPIKVKTSAISKVDMSEFSSTEKRHNSVDVTSDSSTFQRDVLVGLSIIWTKVETWFSSSQIITGTDTEIFSSILDIFTNRLSITTNMRPNFIKITTNGH